MNIFEIILIFTILNFTILIFFSKLIAFINIYDIPNIRKIHKKKTPLIGGFIVLLNFILFYITNTLGFISNSLEQTVLLGNLNNLFFFSILIYLLGFFDDKYDLNPNLKLLVLTILISIFIFFDESLLIKNLNFSFLNKEIGVGNFSYVLTVLCYLLFINACNMFDGINLQSGIYFLIFVITLSILGNFSILNIVLIISLLAFLFLNYNGRTFMGDGGVYLISFILGYLSIKTYNLDLINDVDTIFLIMMIPGIDMLRMFIIRVIKKKNPFRPDKNHLHHLLLTKFKYFKTIIIINLMIITPIFICFTGVSNILNIILFIIIYSYLIINLKYQK